MVLLARSCELKKHRDVTQFKVADLFQHCNVVSQCRGTKCYSTCLPSSTSQRLLQQDTPNHRESQSSKATAFWEVQICIEPAPKKAVKLGGRRLPSSQIPAGSLHQNFKATESNQARQHWHSWWAAQRMQQLRRPFEATSAHPRLTSLLDLPGLLISELLPV